MKWGDIKPFVNYRSDRKPNRKGRTQRTQTRSQIGQHLTGQARLREAYIQLSRNLQPTLFVTFSFGYRINHITAEGNISKLLNAVQREAYGRNWYKLGAPDRIAALGFLEHRDSNPHYHVLIALNAKHEAAMNKIAVRVWGEHVRRGQIHVEITRSLDAVINYCIKEQIGFRAFEEVFAYSPGSNSSFGNR